jgi:GT2 family glycosyltransferase
MNQQKTMDVSIIIVSYNTRDLTIQCLDSIFKQTKNIEFEVIVSKHAIKERFPQVLLIENNENTGFGKANNIGAQQAIGKYILFLNSDTLLLNNAIKYFYDFFESSQQIKIGATGSILLDWRQNITHSSGIFPTKLKTLQSVMIRYFSKYYWENYRQKELQMYRNSTTVLELEVDYVTGADLFISKDLFERTGGFDPDFFLYFEETDLQKRIKNGGYINMVIKGPQIIHLEGGSNSFLPTTLKGRILVTQSMFLYFKKHSNPLAYFLFRCIYFFVRLPMIFDTRFSLIERIKYFIFLCKK